MIRPILIALLAFILIALIGMWVLSGGPRRTIDRIKGIDVVGTVTPDDEVGFRLPWQPAQLFPTFDITDALLVSTPGSEEADLESQYYDLEEEYNRLNRAANEVRTFGNPSPHTGAVSIVEDISGVRASDPKEEYIQLSANFQNSASIDIAGWSFESALSGARVYIPSGASPFLMGTTNSIGPVSLDPGGLVIISSASSPVGVSFRENICTGYLEQFQSFSPQLGNECPSPSSVLPLTDENLRRYGDSCFDIVSSLSSCQFPQTLPESVLPSCRAYLTDALSYNGCVNRNRYAPAFKKNMWRVYLGAQSEIWRNSHDAIRLLDAQGKTVDVFVY